MKMKQTAQWNGNNIEVMKIWNCRKECIRQPASSGEISKYEETNEEKRK